MINLLEILTQNKNILLYRPELNALTNYIPATILLERIIYHWFINDRQKFYKFKVPPETEHKLYRAGDSWCEELGFTPKVFDKAIKTIGFKLGKTKNLIKKSEAFVIYYTDRERLTWYELNEKLVTKLITLEDKESKDNE